MKFAHNTSPTKIGRDSLDHGERTPILAGILSFLTPGLGHVYLGQARRGGFFMFLHLLFFAMFLGSLRIVDSGALYPALPLLFPIAVFGLYIYQVADCVRLARKRAPFVPKHYNRWYIYVLVFITCVAVTKGLATGARTFVTQAYKIPSGAMIPTLLIGDHILVDKLAYRLDPPSRYEIIVFLYPEDETKTFVKRIIGLPGNVIEIRNKVVYINGEPLDDSTYTQRVDPGIIDGRINPRDNLAPLTVPPDSYFVMGDNRDQSLDSRFWGFVNREKILGKVDRVYWSWNDDASGFEAVRWERIGQPPTTPPTPPHFDKWEALSLLYEGKYNDSCKCVLLSNVPMDLQKYAQGAKWGAQPASSLPFVKNETPHMFFLATVNMYDQQGQKEECTACTGGVGGAIFEFSQHRWLIKARSQLVAGGLYYGAEPDAYIQRIGPNKFGALWTMKEGNQDYLKTSLKLVAEINGELKELIGEEIIVAEEEPAWPLDDTPWRISYYMDSSYYFIAGRHPEFDDLKIISRVENIENYPMPITLRHRHVWSWNSEYPTFRTRTFTFVRESYKYLSEREVGFPDMKATVGPRQSASKPSPGINRYLAMVEDAIDGQWVAPPLMASSPLVVVKFRVSRSGEISQIRIAESSGNTDYDSAAQRAVQAVNPLPPFPSDISESFFDVQYRFIKD